MRKSRSPLFRVCAVLAVLFFCGLFSSYGFNPGPPGGGAPAAPGGGSLQLSGADTVQEYGEMETMGDNGEHLHAYFTYPKTGLASVDEEIHGWILSVHDNAHSKLESMREKNASADMEVNVQYNSHLIDGGAYAGIEEIGLEDNSGLAHAFDFYKNFNVDIAGGRLLSNDEILDPQKQTAVLDLLRGALLAAYPKFSDAINAADASWLDHIVLTPGGVDVLLERGKLPTYLGPQRVHLSKSDLGGAYLLPEGNAGAAAPGPAAGAVPSSPGSGNGVDPAKPMVALTFDDGPSPTTPKILELLRQNGGRATFFVVGNRLSAYPQAARDIVAQGSEIMGHTWDHKELTNLSANAIRKEFTDTDAAAWEIAGVRPRAYRPPYGSVNDSVKAVAKELGISLIDWSVDSLDWKSRSADAVYDEIMGQVEDGSIILCHDLYASTAEAMARVIPELLRQGYQLVTVSELLTASGGAMEAGTVYYTK